MKNGTVNNGPTISGATTNVLTIINAQTTNSGNYTVIVTNIAGSVTSSNAVLTVTNIPPKITVQPTSQTNGVGTTVTLAVTATGTAPLSYQWQVSGTNLVNVWADISGATSNVLTIRTVQTNNSGNYTVVVTNIAGSVTSSVAILTVQSSPVITLQPTSQTICGGIKCDFYRQRHRDGAVELPMVGERDEPGEEWNRYKWSDHQWRDHQYADHHQCADEQQRQLHGHRHKHCRIGDQFHRRPDGDEYSAGDHSATDEPDGGGGNDCNPGCHRDRNGAVELPMAGERDELGE